MSKIECSNICGYSSVLRDLTSNLFKELDKDIFSECKELEEYKVLLEKIEMIK